MLHCLNLDTHDIALVILSHKSSKSDVAILSYGANKDKKLKKQHILHHNFLLL